MSQRYIGVTLPLRLGNTGMFEQSSDIIIQVRSNFKNLILTKKGERLGKPTLGCDLWKVLFDQTTEDIYEAARLAVVEAVDTWLPYLEVTDFQIKQDSINPNVINITCQYRFRNNPRVLDQISISTNLLGTPTVTFEDESATQTTSSTSDSTRRRRTT